MPDNNPEKENQPFRFTYTESLVEFFEQLGITLLVTTYQAGKLCAFRAREGKIRMLPRDFPKAMGVAADRTRMAVATKYQVWFLENIPDVAPKVEPRDTFDACYIPRRSHVTSNIDLHEIAWGGNELWLVNTLFSCLATIDERHSFVPRWQPPFISRLSRQDRCHLNGLAMVNEEPAFVTLFAQTDTPQGWREHKRSGGVVMHVGSGEVVASGLSMPHSPRVHGGRLWVLDSGNGALVAIDPRSGAMETVVRFDSYPRGLAFAGKFAFVGLSKIREKHIFGDTAVGENNQERHCGVAVVDLAAGNVIGQLEFEHTVDEIFDVQLLEGSRFPTVVGFNQDTIERTARIGASAGLPGRRSTRIAPLKREEADAKITQGLKHLRADRSDRAVICFQEALKLAPDHPKAYNNLGYVLLQQDDIQGAIANCQQAVRYDPRYHLAHNNLGNGLRANGEYRLAGSHYEIAIELKPGYVQAWYNLGVVLCELWRLDEAIARLKQAIKLQPDLSVAWNRLAEVYCRIGEFDKSLEHHARAIALEPDNSRFVTDSGLVLTRAGRLDQAVQTYKQAIAMEPDNVDYHSDLALALLMNGDYIEGWREHDWRFDAVRGGAIWLTAEGKQVSVDVPDIDQPRRSFFPQPDWDGNAALENRKLLIWAEQGIGDEFMFASMFNEIIDAAKHCTIECDHRSIALMERSFPNAEIVGKSAPAQAATQSRDIDFKCAMGSLGRWLRPDVESFRQVKTGYLKADPERRDQLRERYIGEGKKHLVGIAWRTANTGSGRQRTISLELWHPLLQMPDLQFVNLQYGDCSEELETLHEQTGVNVIDDSEIDSIKDLDALAAQIAAMDLVISIDNSTVHLAGALGIPTWTLLPYSADWRWMLERTDSPWYPTMRLFRQNTFGDWGCVINQVVAILESKFCGKREKGG